METILIAYNNAPLSELHSFFESCADDAKQFCADNNHDYHPICPPELLEQKIADLKDTSTVFFWASHGDSYGIYNDNDEYVVSTNTTNYHFTGKTFYAVSCMCADCLMPELKRIGLSTFVGYDDNLRVIEAEPMFRESAMEGLKAILEGASKNAAKKRMFDKYNECIGTATDDNVKMFLIHNREHLCFE